MQDADGATLCEVRVDLLRVRRKYVGLYSDLPFRDPDEELRNCRGGVVAGDER